MTNENKRGQIDTVMMRNSFYWVKFNTESMSNFICTVKWNIFEAGIYRI